MKSLLAVLVGLSLSSGAMAAAVVTSITPITLTPITLTQISATQYAGQFTGSAASNSFSFDLTGFVSTINNGTALLTANSLGGQGYDISGATFDGVAFTPVVNVTVPGVTSVDYFTFGPAASLFAGLHTIVVNGSGNGSFTGSLSLSTTAITPPPLSAVPEPETYAMMLAGLGAIGFLARRRRNG